MFPTIQRLGILILVASSLEFVISFGNPLQAKASSITLRDGSRCEGQFQGLNGRGLCVYSQGEAGSQGASGNAYDYYKGEVRNGLPNGTGIFVYQNGSRYEGQVRNGAPNGRGMFLLPNNDRYEGEVRNGQSNGTGTFTFANGDRYVGGFRNGQRHGIGTYTFTLEDNKVRFRYSYTGEFYLGQVNGNGVLTYPNGVRCTGTFYDSNFSGKGTCTNFPRGSIYRNYTGELRNGIPEGRGVLTYRTGQVYSGEFRNGKPGISQSQEREE